MQDIYFPLESRSWDEMVEMALPLAESHVAAGFPSPADDYIEKQLDLNEHVVKNPAATFFVRVSGDSMTGAGIHDGDILVVDRSKDPSMGKVVIAVVEGEMVVKRLRKLKGKFFLMPENEAYPPLEITEDTDCKIWGVVTHVVHAL